MVLHVPCGSLKGAAAASVLNTPSSSAVSKVWIGGGFTLRNWNAQFSVGDGDSEKAGDLSQDKEQTTSKRMKPLGEHLENSKQNVGGGSEEQDGGRNTRSPSLAAKVRKKRERTGTVTAATASTYFAENWETGNSDTDTEGGGSGSMNTQYTTDKPKIGTAVIAGLNTKDDQPLKPLSLLSSFSAEATTDANVSQHTSESTNTKVAQHTSEATNTIVAQHTSDATNNTTVAQHTSDATNNTTVAQYTSEATNTIVAQHTSEATNTTVAQHTSDATNNTTVAQHTSESTNTTVSQYTSKATNNTTVAQHASKATNTTVPQHTPEATDSTTVTKHTLEATHNANESHHRSEARKNGSTTDRMLSTICTLPINIKSSEARETLIQRSSTTSSILTSPESWVTEHSHRNIRGDRRGNVNTQWTTEKPKRGEESLVMADLTTQDDQQLKTPSWLSSFSTEATNINANMTAESSFTTSSTEPMYTQASVSDHKFPTFSTPPEDMDASQTGDSAVPSSSAASQMSTSAKASGFHILDSDKFIHSSPSSTTVSQTEANINNKVVASKKSFLLVSSSQSDADAVTVDQEGQPKCYGDFLIYSTIESFCSGEAWSCEGKCGQFKDVPCSCHPTCDVYRTCCHDYTRFCPLGTCSRFLDATLISEAEFGHFLEDFPGIRVPFNSAWLDLSTDETKTDVSPHKGNLTADPSETATDSNSAEVFRARFHPTTGMGLNNASVVGAAKAMGVQTGARPVASLSEESEIKSSTVVPAKIPEVTSSFLHSMPLTTHQPVYSVSLQNGTHISFNTSQTGEVSENATFTSVTQEDSPEPLERPRAHCNPAVHARVIDYCPDLTSDVAVRKACEADNPVDLTWVIPVTDTNTNLHFRNRYCHSCWHRYLRWMDREKKKCMGQDSETGSVHAYTPWQADIHMSFSSRPLHDDSLEDIIHYIVENPSAIAWKSPSGFPHHRCSVESDRQDCTSCVNKATHPVIHHLSYLCKQSYSFVEVEDRVYANKFCAVCDRASQLVHSTEWASNDTVSAALNNTPCAVPEPAIVSKALHNFGFSATMQWSETKGMWVLENSDDGNEDDNESMGRPPPGLLSWEKLICNSGSCTPVSCSPYVWQRNGTCLTDTMPVTTLLSLCLQTSLINARCSSQLSVFVGKDPNLFLSRLKDQALHISLNLCPVMKGLEAKDIEASVEILDGEIYFTYVSPLHMRYDPADPSFFPNRTALVSSVANAMQQLGFSGWVQVCLYLTKYRMTPLIAQKVITPPSCNYLWRKHQPLSSDSSSGKSAYRLCCQLCVVLGMHLLGPLLLAF